MSSHTSESAALLALLSLRPERMPWPRIAAEVADGWSATEVLARFDTGLVHSPDVDSALAAAAANLATWEAEGLNFVSILDDRYPQRLRDIREAPPFVFAEGTLVSRDQGVSIVGSRKASAASLEQAAAVADHLVSEGLTVVSGLAEGIDTAAHRAALAAGGRTVAFLGTGIKKVYPAMNRELHREIASKGLLVSQFLPDAPPTRHSFPMRNALMSGYGLATVVIEAGEKSGARIQARVAGEHGRPVVLTSRVVESTQWGSAMAGSRNVYVVRNLREVREAIVRIREAPRAFDRALSALTAA